MRPKREQRIRWAVEDCIGDLVEAQAAGGAPDGRGAALLPDEAVACRSRFGDGGRIYFLMRRPDLQAHRWERCAGPTSRLTAGNEAGSSCSATEATERRALIANRSHRPAPGRTSPGSYDAGDV